VTPRSPDSDRPLASAAAAGATPPQAQTTTHPDFQYLAAVSIAPAALGYRVAATEEENGFALRALATPLSHQATLKLQMKPLVEAGRLQTGFLVFGDGTADEQLVKCGVRVRAHKALIIQGAMKNAGVSQPFTAPADAPFEVEVAVDFEKHTVRMSLPGPTTVEAPLDPALARITHVGYGTMNAVTEFSPVSVVGK
jgi:hypothetical protein